MYAVTIWHRHVRVAHIQWGRAVRRRDCVAHRRVYDAVEFIREVPEIHGGGHRAFRFSRAVSRGRDASGKSSCLQGYRLRWSWVSRCSYGSAVTCQMPGRSG